jgi:hypothetical protein
MGMMILVETTLAINTIKGTQLAITRQQVDTQGYPQSATVYRAENGRGINHC